MTTITNVRSASLKEISAYPWKGLRIELDDNGELSRLSATKGEWIFVREQGGLISLHWKEKKLIPLGFQTVHFQFSSKRKIHLAAVFGAGNTDKKTNWQERLVYLEDDE